MELDVENRDINTFNLDFCEELEKALKGAGGRVAAVSVPKNNVVLQSAMVKLPDRPEGIVVYPDRYLQDWLDGVPMGDIISSVKELLLRMPALDLPDKWMDRRRAEKDLRAAIVSYEPNKEWLKDMPHERTEDLAVYAKWKMGEDKSFKVTDAVAGELRMTREEILQAAKDNTFQNMWIEPMDSVLEKMTGTPVKSESRLWVVGTRDGADGAVLMADPRALAEVKRRLGDDFYIFPSSVHEFIAHPKSGCTENDLEWFQKMIRDINEQEVLPEDRLSDHLYGSDGRGFHIVGPNGREMPREGGSVLPEDDGHHRRR